MNSMQLGQGIFTIIGAVITAVAMIVVAVITVRHRRDKSPSNGDHFFIVLGRTDIISANASIRINGKAVGSLSIDSHKTIDQLKVDLSYKGSVKYEIEGTRDLLLRDMDSNEVVDRSTAFGQGIISPKPGETLRLKFLLELDGHGPAKSIVTLEHAPTPKDIRDTLDSIIVELILDPGEDFQARNKLMDHMMEHSEDFDRSKNDVFDLLLKTTDDELIKYLIHKDLVSESVSAKYHGRAPLGR